ncbi:CHAT domain-containing protein [Dactylosporangium sp. CA-233914]|uniref:CHAT domain-containing protein n=1 Tax=Dactylosporangium sp. CA-233914 TaxID=3239934 RepID=UPI003D93AB43
MVDGSGRVTLSYTPAGAARDVWVGLRAAGLDARLAPDGVLSVVTGSAGGDLTEAPPGGPAGLVEDLRERWGAAAAPRHELRIAVAVAKSRLRATVTLAGTVLCERDEPLPFGRDEVWDLIDLPGAEARLARLGQRLSAALFDDDTLDDLTTLVSTAVEGCVIDVVFEGDGPAHELPFELIRLADQRILATVEGVRTTRMVGGVRVPEHPAAPGPLKILVAVGAPEHTDSPPLDVEAEMQAIVSVVGEVGRAEITILEVAGPAEIAAALRRDAYHVLHLSAHGSPYGVELEDRDGNAVDVSAEDLVRALRRGGRPLPLIVLSSCGGAADADAGLAVTLLRHGADRVIAMQTSITDWYATRLLTRVYRALAEREASVAEALAEARSGLFEEVVRSGETRCPEYAVPALFAASDGPLWNADAAPVPLSNPTELPSGDGVRELLLGDLVGRRPLLRVVSQTLRDELAGAPLVGGVVLTGPAGIGKTALAGRVVTRLRDDLDDPWTIVVHAGAWNPPGLLADLAAAGVKLDRDGDGEPDADAAALAALAEALRTDRLLLVFDDFEQNLTVGGGAFLDPGFGEIFAGLCAAAERGKLLVTSRHPVPVAVPLSRLDVPPLTDAELRRLLIRMPGLRDLPIPDRDAVVAAVGGHPRLVEFVDALLNGGARLPEVTARLRTLTEARTFPDAAAATREAIALGARDVLLTDLLDLLSPAEREALLQLAVSRIPVTAADLAWAVAPEDPTAQDVAAMTGHVARLRDLTLAGPAGEDGVVVEPWLREALARHQGDGLVRRHLLAAATCRRIVEDGRAGFDTVTEAVYQLRAAGRVDDLAEFATATLPKLGGELAVAAFLGEVTPGFPVEHPAYGDLIERERDALEATGSTAAAAEKGEEAVRLAARAAKAAPQDTGARIGLSAALDNQGRLLHRLGRLADARRTYERALAIDAGLAEAEPESVQYRRNLAMSHQKIAEVALDDAEFSLARSAAEESLRLRSALAEGEPGDARLQWDLAIGLRCFALTADADAARPRHEQALGIWRRLAADDGDNRALLEHQFDCLISLADLKSDAFAELVKEAATIADRLTDADSGDVDAQRRMLTAQWRLGAMDVAAGDPACAAGHFTGALSLAGRLAGADADGLDAQRDLGTALTRLAEFHAGNDQPQEVRGHLERAMEVAELVVHRFPRNGALHRDLAAARERLADWLREQGDPAAARALCRQALTSRRRRTALDPQDLASRLAEAAVHARIAALDEAAGHPGRARHRWQEALTIVRRLDEEHPAPAHRAAVEEYEARLAA